MDTDVLDHRLGTALAVLNGVFLTLLGLVAGGAVGLSASWLSWLWLVGAVGQGLAVVTTLLVLATLFAGSRALGWSTGAKWGPGAFALGWIASSFALIGVSYGGDVLMTSAPTNYLFLYGGVAAVVMGAVLTPDPATARTRPRGTP
ncbi:hypothetical protein EV190_10183 [Actinorugispora endophytica]|uniref:Uncharacterized protein n=1 Tax=Actinorugispora endophytica TaxID=1605990 RepID=A0A4R6VCR5_9ACTN|nr:hypothetical protein EV190_10183 [Actinorugispora endophytica]